MATIVKKCEHTPAQRRSCKDNWVVRYRDSGGKQREKTFLWNQKEVANTFALDVESKKKAGEYFDPKISSVKFRDAADAWVKTRRTESTRVTYTSLLANHINPAIGNMSIRAVASPEGRDVVEKLLLVTMPAVPVGISRITSAYLVISGVINDAVRRGKLQKSHLSGISLASLGDDTDKADFVFPSHAQLQAMTDLLPAGYRLAIWLMRGCGLRIGEALGVSVTDFISPGVLRVQQQLRAAKLEYGPLKHRKASEYRDVPVPAYVARLVAEHEPQPDGHLFRPIWHANWQRWFNSARDKAGITGNFTSHSLRHAFASVALANGVPITDVSAWLGHIKINTTYSIYGHLVPSSWDRARNVLDVEYDTWSGSGEAQAA